MFRWRNNSDEELIRRVLAGRRESFGILVERYMPTVHAIAYAHTGRSADAEDVAQEAFIRGLQSLPTLHDPHKFGAWLAGITRNVASVAARTAARRNALHERLHSPIALDPVPELERNEMHDLLRAQVMALDEAPREILLLHYFAGKSVREIAEVMDISLEAAKKRLQRAREQLGENLMNQLQPAFEPDKPSHRSIAKTIAAVAAANLAWEATAAPPLISGMTILAGVLAMKKAVLVGTLVVLAAGGVWYSQRDIDQPAPPQASAGAQAPDIGDTAPAITVSEDVPHAPAALAEPVAPTTELAAVEPGSSTSTGGLGLLTGDVVAQNDRPVPGTVVTLREVDRDNPAQLGKIFTAETDAKGAFEMKGLPFTRFVASAETHSALGTADVVLDWGRPKQDVTITLEPTGQIAGIVHDSDGNPIAHAHVFPTERVVEQGYTSREWAIVMQAETDANGAFVLSRLWSPSWELTVQAEGYATTVTEPIPVGAKSAKIILNRGGGIRGTVAMADSGVAVSGAALSLRVPWPGKAETSSGSGGEFVFTSLPPDDYVIEVDHGTLVPIDGAVEVTVAENEETSGVAIALAEGGVITGRLFDAVSNKGLAGLTVRGRVDGTPDREGTSDESGVYRIEGLLSGKYELSAERPEGYLNPGYANEKIVPARVGEVIEGIDFPMTAGIFASGRVVDSQGAPVPNATVSGNPAAWHVQATTDADGKFELTQLEPSNAFYVSAEAKGYACEPLGPLKLAPPGLRDLEVVLVASGGIFGKLVDGEGRPVVGMQMFAWPVRSPGGMALPTSTTAKNGEFSFTELAANDYRMVASPPGSHSIGNNELDRVELSRGQQITGLVLVYDENAGESISGRVTDSSGAPVADADVQLEGPSDGAAVTNADGMYRATRLSEGIYSVGVEGSAGRVVRHSVVASSENVDLVLPGKGQLALTVLGADTSTPITSFEYSIQNGAYQRLDPFRYDHMQRTQSPAGQLVTDAPTGEATVFARADGYALTGAVVNIRPAAEGPTEVVLQLKPSPTLDLTVTNSQGDPVEGAEVYLGDITVYDKPGNRETFLAGITAQDGRFVYSMLEPEHESAYVTHPLYAPAAVSIDPSGTTTTIVMQYGGIIEGTVTQEGAPVDPEHCTMAVSYPDNPGLGRRVFRLTEFPYHLEDIAPGNVSLEATLQQGEPYYAARTVAVPAMVQSGGVTPVDVDVPAWDATIEGRVHENGLATATADVKINLTTASGAEEQLSARTGPDGRFIIEGAPAGTGTIEVRIWERWVDPTAWRTRGPEPITTTAGETTTVDFNFAE